MQLNYFDVFKIIVIAVETEGNHRKFSRI